MKHFDNINNFISNTSTDCFVHYDMYRHAYYIQAVDSNIPQKDFTDLISQITLKFHMSVTEIDYTEMSAYISEDE